MGKPTYEELEKDLLERTRELESLKAEVGSTRADQKEDERRLLRGMFDQLPAFVCLLRGDTTIKYANRHCRELFGDPDSKFCHEYFWKRSTQCKDCPATDVLLWGEPKIIEIQSASESKIYQVAHYPYRDGNGRRLSLAMGIDITERKEMEETLRKTKEELELRVEERTNELQRKNIALTEVLSQLEVEKQNLANRVEENVQKVLLPVIEKLIEKSSSLDSRYLVLIKQNLERLTSSVGLKLSSVEYRLTPKEIELCALIKGGFSIKEIATMHNLSERTVETHRLNIRKKLGLSSSKINLSSYLAHME